MTDIRKPGVVTNELFEKLEQVDLIMKAIEESADYSSFEQWAELAQLSVDVLSDKTLACEESHLLSVEPTGEMSFTLQTVEDQTTQVVSHLSFVSKED